MDECRQAVARALLAAGPAGSGAAAGPALLHPQPEGSSSAAAADGPDAQPWPGDLPPAPFAAMVSPVFSLQIPHGYTYSTHG